MLDATGSGNPVGEDVARVRPNVEQFVFTQSSKQGLMESLAVAIQTRTITFTEGVISEELSNFEYIYTRSGVKYSASSGLHADAVCALALAWRGFKNLGGFSQGTYSFA